MVKAPAQGGEHVRTASNAARSPPTRNVSSPRAAAAVPPPGVMRHVIGASR